MDNYEYIVASLPVLSRDWKSDEGIDSGKVLEWTRSQLSGSDQATLGLLVDGWDDSKLGPEFYKKALSSRNRFIREYFLYDLKLRNAKVRYLNARLGRPEGQDIFRDEKPTPDESAQFSRAFSGEDILGREKAVDDLMWDKADALVQFHYFDLDVILAFMTRLHTIDRWLRLDPEEGKKMFRKLVGEVRGTYKGVQYEEKQ